ncbi:MAG: murein biosynthesis integral membrane protein MurJ [Spirochaetes bacterium]|nr:murein biosynthesis integral membrane protein MurJ [Spirochaetota bacterium]
MDKSILKSTSVVAFSTLASRVLGLVRDMVIGAVFGATGAVDGFWVAFRIPNLFRRLVGEGCLTISFVPVYTEYLVKKGEKEALELAQKTLSILVVVLLFIVIAGVVFSSGIVSLVGFGFSDPAQIDLTVALNRLMFPYLFLVSLVAFSMGYLNSHKYFFAPAFAPVLLNIGFIAGALVLRHFLKVPLYGLAIGVLLGGVLQLLLQVPYMIKAGFRLKFSIDFNHPGIRAIFRMIGPALFGIAVYQVNLLMSTVLASMLPDGSITYIYFSDRLTELVMGVFIISLGNVILPSLSGLSALNDLGKIRDLYTSSVHSALFITIPASAALIVLGLPIISVLFMRGEFNVFTSLMTYKALLYGSIGMFAVSIIRITVPTYYSLKDTKTPVFASAASFIVNIAFGYMLMQTGLKHGGLTLAVSIAATVQMLILIIFLQKRIGKLDLKKFILPILKYTAAAAIMAVAVYYIADQINWLNTDAALIKRIIYLFAIIIAGASVYFLACFFLRVREVSFFWELIYKKIVK